jgi:hypothetical protein
LGIKIYGVFDSTDAAELTATRLKRTVNGINISGISKRIMPDTSEETTLFAYPTLGINPGSFGVMNTFGTAGAVPLSFNQMTSSLHDDNFEPAAREDVKLRVEAPDERTAQSVSMIMRSCGGREISQVTG